MSLDLKQTHRTINIDYRPVNRDYMTENIYNRQTLVARSLVR